MKIQNPFRHISVRMAYSRYRFVLLPVGLLLSGIILMLAVVFPQFQDYQAGRARSEKLTSQNQMLQKNIQVLSAIDDETLSSYAKLSLSALPVRKDYIGILGAISSSAAKSGIGLSDFSFQVGDVDGKNTTDPVKISLQVQGSTSSFQEFLTQLSESLPLSDISNVAITGNSMNLDITFFYKPIAKAQLKGSTALKILTPKDQALMQQLALWPNGNEAFFEGASISQTLPTVPVATGSSEVASSSAF